MTIVYFINEKNEMQQIQADEKVEHNTNKMILLCGFCTLNRNYIGVNDFSIIPIYTICSLTDIYGKLVDGFSIPSPKIF